MSQLHYRTSTRFAPVDSVKKGLEECVDGTKNFCDTGATSLTLVCTLGAKAFYELGADAVALACASSALLGALLIPYCNRQRS